MIARGRRSDSDHTCTARIPTAIMSNKPDKSSFLRAESELILDLVSKGVRQAMDSQLD